MSSPSRLLGFSVRRKFQDAKDNIVNSILDSQPPADDLDIHKEFELSKKTLGDYVTVDYTHRQDILRLIKNIRKFSEDRTLNKPLNYIMIAEPGSGKSHFIKCLVKKLDFAGIKPVTFNMSSLESNDDLLHPLDDIRNLKIQDKLPLLFLDEFDSYPENYALLLPLLWDGELLIGNRNLKLGKLVIILAGSDLSIKNDIVTAKRMRTSDFADLPNDKKKIVDLLSRINGGEFEIPSLNKVTTTRNRKVDKVFITLSLVQNRFGKQIQYVPWSLLNFIANTEFRYGVRSIAYLIDLIPGNIENDDGLVNDDLTLPFGSENAFKRSSLSFHIVPEDESFENIITRWEDVIQHDTIVRFSE